MCSAPNVYMFFYILIGTHMVPLIVVTDKLGYIFDSVCMVLNICQTVALRLQRLHL